MMRLLRRLLSAAREMVRDRSKVMAELDKTERDLDKSLRRSSKSKGLTRIIHEAGR